MFHFAAGLATLLASLLAGRLWQSYGPPLTFAAGAVLSVGSGIPVLGSRTGRKEYRLTS